MLPFSADSYHEVQEQVCELISLRESENYANENIDLYEYINLSI